VGDLSIRETGLGVFLDLPCDIVPARGRRKTSVFRQRMGPEVPLGADRYQPPVIFNDNKPPVKPKDPSSYQDGESKLYSEVCDVYFTHRPKHNGHTWYAPRLGIPKWIFRTPHSKLQRRKQIISMIYRLYVEYRFERSRYRSSVKVRLSDLDPLATQIAQLYHAKWWVTRCVRVIRRLKVLLCP